MNEQDPCPQSGYRAKPDLVLPAFHGIGNIVITSLRTFPCLTSVA